MQIRLRMELLHLSQQLSHSRINTTTKDGYQMYALLNHFSVVAIGSALFASIANLLARTLLKNVKAQEMLGINFLIMGATLVLFSPLFYMFKVSLLAMGLVMLIALIDCAANFFYFKTFE